MYLRCTLCKRAQPSRIVETLEGTINGKTVRACGECRRRLSEGTLKPQFDPLPKGRAKRQRVASVAQVERLAAHFNEGR